MVHSASNPHWEMASRTTTEHQVKHTQQMFISWKTFILPTSCWWDNQIPVYFPFYRWQKLKSISQLNRCGKSKITIPIPLHQVQHIIMATVDNIFQHSEQWIILSTFIHRSWNWFCSNFKLSSHNKCPIYKSPIHLISGWGYCKKHQQDCILVDKMLGDKRCWTIYSIYFLYNISRENLEILHFTQRTL